MDVNRNAIIIGISSDIGTALSKKWLKDGWKIYGTYKTKSKKLDELKNLGAHLLECDIAEKSSIDKICLELKETCLNWDVLVICPASLKPVGNFISSDFGEWEDSVELNFIDQMKVVHKLLPSRNKGSSISPCTIFFSGGGINDAPTNYSAYIVSKIATIKMTEILDIEIPDTRFVSIGPGWVDTKIHKETLKAGSKAGDNHRKTLKRIKNREFTPMNRVIKCCEWIINTSKEVVGGRNIHVLHDSWGDKEFVDKLAKNPNLLKLRKYGSIK